MPTQRQTVPDRWHETGRIAAGEDTAIMITETEGRALYWALTETEASPPDLFEADGHRIDGYEQQPLVLKAGEVLWLSGRGEAGACTVTAGPA